MATIKEIAAICGTSRGTVDRVLNNRGHVNPLTAEAILKAAAELNYTPNKAGKSLAVRKKNYRIAYILCDNKGEHPFYTSVRKGIVKKTAELAEYGISVDVFSCSADGFNRQMEIMEHCEEEKYDGIAITPVNHPEIAVKLREISESGIAVVTVNSDMEFSGRISYVGSNYKIAGKTAAGLITLITAGKANVGVVGGFPDVLCHTERIDSFCSYINEISDSIKICAMCENNDDDDISYKKTKEMIAGYPEIDALFLAAAGVYGAAKAVEDAGKAGKIKIVCFDAVPQTVKMMNKGVIAAAICQEPEYQGEKPLEILSDFLAFGVKPEKYYYCSTDIIIKENYEG